MTDRVRLVEVGPRDGLQNEKTPISIQDRVQLVNALVQTGIRHIEVGSFVSPKWVPQMEHTDQVLASIQRIPECTYSVLIPNIKGFELALPYKPNEIAVFSAASETFTHKNINCSIEESLERFKPIVNKAKEHNISVRGYISCVVGCPYEGSINSNAVAQLASQLLTLGCDEISLGDTIGVGTPKSISAMLKAVLKEIDVSKLALHCHDTYGQALVNIATGLNLGIRVIDASVAGLGGCPYAKGASGNVASEDVIYFLNNEGFSTGIDLTALKDVGHFISTLVGRPTQSKVGLALSVP